MRAQLPARPIPHEAKKAPFWLDETGSAPNGGAENYPLFVIGSARSGTTALCLGLKLATRYDGFPEGHVLDIAIRLATAVNEHLERKEAWIKPGAQAAFHLGQLAHGRVQAEIIELLRRLTGGFTTPYWFDKTPTYQMVASIPLLSQAWPNAQFIFMKRRGLENVRSRIRKFTRSDFSSACHDWALIMREWRIVRDAIPGRFIEIDQHTLALNPGAAAASAGRLLNLNPEEVEALTNVLRHKRPEALVGAECIISDLSELDWSTEQVEKFREECDAEMIAYGYTYDARYCC
jgi:Sulfotransferase family